MATSVHPLLSSQVILVGKASYTGTCSYVALTDPRAAACKPRQLAFVHTSGLLIRVLRLIKMPLFPFLCWYHRLVSTAITALSLSISKFPFCSLKIEALTVLIGDSPGILVQKERTLPLNGVLLRSKILSREDRHLTGSVKAGPSNAKHEPGPSSRVSSHITVVRFIVSLCICVLINLLICNYFIFFWMLVSLPFRQSFEEILMLFCSVALFSILKEQLLQSHLSQMFFSHMLVIMFESIWCPRMTVRKQNQILIYCVLK